MLLKSMTANNIRKRRDDEYLWRCDGDSVKKSKENNGRRRRRLILLDEILSKCVCARFSRTYQRLTAESIALVNVRANENIKHPLDDFVFRIYYGRLYISRVHLQNILYERDV